MKKKRMILILIVNGILASSLAAAGEYFRPDEMIWKDEWMAVNVPNAPAKESSPAVVVLQNLGCVTPDARAGEPLRIGQTEFKRGLFCHANSLLEIRLPSAGDTFSAMAGLDHNDDTARGRGSVVFSVKISGREVFKSQIMRYGTEAQPVSVDLAGARTFTLQISDAGDGVGWDQADWAEAKVILAGGKELYLSDLPGVQQPRMSPLFSFVYDGKPSAELLPDFRRTDESRKLDNDRSQHTTTWIDPGTGLEVRLTIVEYHDFPVVEWTAWFKNTGQADTPLLEDIQGMDLSLACWRTTGEGQPSGEFVLKTIRGDDCSAASYQPIVVRLGRDASRSFAPLGGRPTCGAFPYYNLEWYGQGVILALGWPGQWSARFERRGATGLRVVGGQELLKCRLHPGEAIRAPLSVVMFYKGDGIRSQNLWRRWMIAHNLPRPGGRLPQPFMPGGSSLQFNEMTQADEKSQKFFIDRYLQNGVQLDYWWMDAGWYPCDGAWWRTGTWEPDPKRFPEGLRPVSNHAHEKGLKTVVWFEPERVHPATWLYTEHPEWLLGNDGGLKLLYLGNPAALAWLIDHVDRLLSEQGIDLYRQDFNFDPLPYWRAADPPDRQGMTENLHLQGYLAYWDELRRRHPDLLLDSCASGGRRNDLETLRRSVPLHKTDYNYWDLPVKQAFHHSLFSWIPFFGAPVLPIDRVDPYAFRSAMAPCTALGFDVRRDDLDYGLLARLARQWHQVAPLYYGDYYPLMNYSVADDVWLAWQFDRPGAGDGMVQVYRRPDSAYESVRLRLGGLDPGSRYAFIDMDTGQTREAAGKELLEKGLLVATEARPAAMLWTYKRLP